MDKYTQYIGIFAGICTAISLLPQLVKILKTKKAEDISWFYLIILLTGLAGWIVYGFLKDDFPIIITNCFSFLVNVLVMIFTRIYKQEKS
jgi:MtN3 and saliva related transmembrane protein